MGDGAQHRRRQIVLGSDHSLCVPVELCIYESARLTGCGPRVASTFHERYLTMCGGAVSAQDTAGAAPAGRSATGEARLSRERLVQATAW
jgi:hypothetical protein